MMSRRARILLALIGLLLVAVSLAALSFAWSPVEILVDKTQIAPTLFTLPAGGLP